MDPCLERDAAPLTNDSQAPTVISIQLTPLQLQNEPKDDWSGVTSTAERRRRQNRIHQRAWRQRRRGLDQSGASVSVATDTGSDAKAGIIAFTRSNDQIWAREGCHLLASPEARATWEAFTVRAYRDYERGTPQLIHLGVLVKINVLAAFASNADLLGFKFEGLCSSTLISPFNQAGPGSNIVSPWPSCPQWLQPTQLQRSILHHPWIDLIPLPRLRDNILRTIATGFKDNTPLAMDILDVQDRGNEAACLIVWGASWKPTSWEISIPFLRKWGAVLEGCDEMIQATNSWRCKRNERHITYTSQLTRKN